MWYTFGEEGQFDVFTKGALPGFVHPFYWFLLCLRISKSKHVGSGLLEPPKDVSFFRIDLHLLIECEFAALRWLLALYFREHPSLHLHLLHPLHDLLRSFSHYRHLVLLQHLVLYLGTVATLSFRLTVDRQVQRNHLLAFVLLFLQDWYLVAQSLDVLGVPVTTIFIEGDILWLLLQGRDLLLQSGYLGGYLLGAKSDSGVLLWV